MSTINQQNGNTLLTTGAFPPVRAISTGSPLNPATGGLLTVDGVALVAGDRVLCKDETDKTTNGIYAAATGPWTRTSDAGSNQNFFQGMTVTAGPQGAVNAGQTFVCTTTDDPVVVGTSLITFASQSVVQTQQQTATSTTSLTIGTGSKTWAIQAGKAFQVGQWVLAQQTSNSANQMLGKVTSYSGTSLVVNVTAVGGSGTIADWTIVLTNSPAAAGFQPPTGTGNVTGPGGATDGNLAVFNGTSGLVIKDGGTPVGAANTLTPVMFTNAALGFALGMLNGKIVTSVAANALTIAIKTLAGTDPTSTDVTVFFITDGAGGWTPIKLTSALSLTVPAGATLGTVNNQAGRQYFTVWNNGGTAVLGIYNALNASVSTSPSILCWDETSAANGTGITSGSTSAQVHYTASSLTSKNFRVIGVLESTQVTAGQWAAAVTAKLFGPGSKKPGDVVGEVFSINTSSESLTSTPNFAHVPSSTVAGVIQSAANVIRIDSNGSLTLNGTSNATTTLGISRGTSDNTGMLTPNTTVALGTSLVGAGAPLTAYDMPGAAGSTTYALQSKNNIASTATYQANSSMTFKEIQI